ncbi:MAG: PD40 domain-containing protein [Phycisphaerae bacterium]|nr:PD40 domain-containing protein [Phycisphaerae bacterium]
MNTVRHEAAVSLLMISMATALMGTSPATGEFVFGEPQNLGPPINTSSWDWMLVISPDNLQMYVNSDRPGGLGYFDIWYSTRERPDEPWGPLVNLQEINGPYNESYPCFSADGLTLYFSDWYTWNTAGDRPGGIGGHDLWMRTRSSTDLPWGPPVNLGAIVNSPAAEVSPCISEDGRSLLFASKRSGGLGDYDLWMSTRSGLESNWGTPVNLGPVVNSGAYDAETWFSPDGLALLFSSNRAGGMGSYDLYLTTRRSQDAAWSPPVNLGPAVNTGNGEGTPSVSPDLKTLYFTSDRPGGFGNWDIYEVPIMPVLDFNGDGKVAIADLTRLIESWGQDDPTTDVGPAPWGDGKVDAADLDVLMSAWGQEVSDSTLIAHWTLDETEGLIAYDAVGDNDGAVMGTPAWQPASGKVGGAMQFDGATLITANSVLSPADGPFSVLAWVKGGVPRQTIVSQEDGANWLMAGALDGTLATEVVPPAGRIAASPLISGVLITDGLWHRVAFTWDGSKRRLYVDDVLAAEDGQSSLANCSGGLNIGCGEDMAPGSFWSGVIDDIRIYDRAVKP